MYLQMVVLIDTSRYVNLLNKTKVSVIIKDSVLDSHILFLQIQ